MTNDEWLAMPAPKYEVEKKVLEGNPRYQVYVDALADLTPAQRTYIKALPAADYVPVQAMRMLKTQGRANISERTVYRWMSDPAVKRAVTMQRELAHEYAGVDALSVMLRVSAWAEYCAETIEIKDDEGKVVGTKKRDAANGLKALELLGKHTRALGDDAAPSQRQLPAFIVGVNISTPKPEAIDVTFTEVKR